MLKSEVSEKLESCAQMEPNSGCWIWDKSGNGRYGKIMIEGERYLAHRLSYIVNKGDIPDGMHVMHSCDNTWCINPEHLSIGTAKDNALDKADKGRARNGSGLRRDFDMEREVMSLRKSGMIYREIATSVGARNSEHVRSIVRRLS